MTDRDAFFEEMKALANPVNRAAIDELEARGFAFLYHFGYENAAEHLRAMNIARDSGFLYEHLRSRYGMQL